MRMSTVIVASGGVRNTNQLQISLCSNKSVEKIWLQHPKNS
jgi:hypothetical protein